MEYELVQQLLRCFALRSQVTDPHAAAALDDMIARLRSVLSGDAPAMLRPRVTSVEEMS